VITEERCGGVVVKEDVTSKDVSLVSMKQRMKIKTIWMMATKMAKHCLEMLGVCVVKKSDTE
jgi:hypothetical protein